MKKIFTLFASFFVLKSAQAQTVTGGDMESWSTYSALTLTMEKPTNWNTLDSIIGVFKTFGGTPYSARVLKSSTIKNSGTYSAKLITTGSDSFPTLLSNGNVKYDLTLLPDLAAGDYSKLQFSGGTSVSKRIAFGHAYIRYNTSAATDKGTFTITAFKNGIAAGGKDSVVGSGTVDIANTSSFVKQTVYITYVDATVIPDRIVFVFNAGTVFPPTAGNEMYVDDVSYSDPTGIEIPVVNDNRVQIFPNPAKNDLHIKSSINGKLIISFYNAMGQLVFYQNFANETRISLANMVDGNYIYVISSAEGNKMYSGTLQKL